MNRLYFLYAFWVATEIVQQIEPAKIVNTPWLSALKSEFMYFLPLFFRINDRVISANNVSLEGVDYATAVQVLRDSGQNVNLVVKRRVILPQPIPASTLMLSEQPKYLNVSLQRSKKKEDFGVVLGCKIYIKEIISRTVADKDGILKVRYSEKAIKFLKNFSLCLN